MLTERASSVHADALVAETPRGWSDPCSLSCFPCGQRDPCGPATALPRREEVCHDCVNALSACSLPKETC
ncbi:hypothetical protein EON65_45475 [archaeon]|nr:MAG: hypothetical protein EON65_45475 [archaeon]